jgi:hypothetical protein
MIHSLKKYRQKIRKTLSDPSTIEKHIKTSSVKKNKPIAKTKKGNHHSKTNLNKSKKEK